MNIVRPIVWALRFLFELLALAAFAIGGWSLTSGPLRIALAIALPVIAAVVWGLWMAPRSTRRLRDPSRFVVEVVFFLAAGAALWVAGQAAAGIALSVIAIAISALVRLPALIPPGQAELP